MKVTPRGSSFHKFQLVRACFRPGFSFSTGAMPHDHNNPRQHFDSRVMGWDSIGRIMIAIAVNEENPHRSEWCWTEDMIHPRQDHDWVDSSPFQIDQRTSFTWELTGFWEEKLFGKKVKAIIKAPHIKQGDWVVLYEKPSGDWITRVLNERQMQLD